MLRARITCLSLKLRRCFRASLRGKDMDRLRRRAQFVRHVCQELGLVFPKSGPFSAAFSRSALRACSIFLVLALDLGRFDRRLRPFARALSLLLEFLLWDCIPTRELAGSAGETLRCASLPRWLLSTTPLDCVVREIQVRVGECVERGEFDTVPWFSPSKSTGSTTIRPAGKGLAEAGANRRVIDGTCERRMRLLFPGALADETHRRRRGAPHGRGAWRMAASSAGSTRHCRRKPLDKLCLAWA